MARTCRPAANRRLHLVTPEPHREVELAVLVLATAVSTLVRLLSLRRLMGPTARPEDNLGYLLANRWDPPDLPEARRWLEQAAAAGNTNAMYGLGYLLANWWEPPDLPETRRWLERAAAGKIGATGD